MRTKIVLIDKGDGKMKSVMRGCTCHIAAMLMEALVETMAENKKEGVTNEELADAFRDMVLQGLKEEKYSENL